RSHKTLLMKLFMRNEFNTQARILRRLPAVLPMMMMMMMLLLQLPLPLLPACAYASVMVGNTTCKHATDMWGDPNPNIFYVCSAADQMPLQLQCPQGRGFFNGLGHLGCLPYDQWPACRPATEQASAQLAAGCDNGAKTKEQPWAAADPNRFYMCPGANATPLLLSCASGKGFVQSPLTVGCADWSLWRRHMQCEEYF
ncbi:hypothetical protein KR222_005748, partial [Zaprionus bogoriensis]